MRWLLDLFYTIALLLALPYLIWRWVRTRKYLRGLSERFGFLPARRTNRPALWVHAVSVGELQAAKTLVPALAQRFPQYEVIITHTTRTGEDVARKLFADEQCVYSPLDFSLVTEKFFRHFNPRLLVLIELELWPNLLLCARRHQVPVLLASARITEKSARGYARFGWLFRTPLAALSHAAVQNQEYRDRLTGLLSELGMDATPVSIAGNLKFDGIASGRDLALRSRYRALFGIAPQECLLVCGSTHPGEHEELLRLYRVWRNDKLALRMLIVPRHPERRDEVRSLWRRAGMRLVDRSSLKDTDEPKLPSVPVGELPPGFLLDTMGELAQVYHAADIVFVGGSMIPHGGQNMAEPAALEAAVLFGPHTSNFRATVKTLLARQAAIEVQTWDQLEREVRELCGDAERRAGMGTRARAAIDEGKGATARHMQLIEELLR